MTLSMFAFIDPHPNHNRLRRGQACLTLITNEFTFCPEMFPQPRERLCLMLLFKPQRASTWFQITLQRLTPGPAESPILPMILQKPPYEILHLLVPTLFRPRQRRRPVLSSQRRIGASFQI